MTHSLLLNESTKWLYVKVIPRKGC